MPVEIKLTDGSTLLVTDIRGDAAEIADAFNAAASQGRELVPMTLDTGDIVHINPRAIVTVRDVAPPS